MGYKYVMFDLDGTLTDSGSGILSSVRYALEKMEWDIPCDEILKRFIGPPLDYSFMNFTGMNESEAERAIAYYRENYKVKGIYDNRVYDGVREALEALKKEGVTLFVATSKPEFFTLKILSHFELDGYFDFVAAALFDGTRKNKEDVIEYALEHIKTENVRNDVLMVGDRMHDIEGAHAFGIRCAAVLYGFGDREEFERYGADYIVEKPQQIVDLVKM